MASDLKFYTTILYFSHLLQWFPTLLACEPFKTKQCVLATPQPVIPKKKII